MPRPRDVNSSAAAVGSSARLSLRPSTIPTNETDETNETNETNKDRLRVRLDTLATEFEKAAEAVEGDDYSKRIAGCYGHLAAFTRSGSELLLTERASLIPQIQNCHYFLKHAVEAIKQPQKDKWNTLSAGTAKAEESVFEAVVFDRCPDPNSEFDLENKKIHTAYFHYNGKYFAGNF
jgi:hypothetical protein